MAFVSKADEKNLTVSITSLPGSDGALFTDADEAQSGEKSDDEVFPDGGSAAWLQVLGGHFANAVGCGYGATFGIFQLYYTETLNLPASEISWIGSFQVFLTNAVCIVCGQLTDTGRAREALFAGSVLVLLGTFMTSLATEYWHIFLAQGLCTGIGLGLVWVPPSFMFLYRTLTCNSLIPKIGFPWAIRCFGFVAMVMVVLMNILMKPCLKPQKKTSLVDWQAFREVPYVLFMAGTFIFYWALYFGTFYLNSFAITLPDHAFTATSTVNLLLLTNAVSIPARIFIGFLADFYTGPLNAYILSVASLALTLFAWTAVATGPAMYAWSAAFGVATGASQAAFVGAMAALTADPRKMGVRFGMVCTINAFAVLAGPPTAGALVDLDGGRYMWAQIWGGSVEVVAVLVLGVARWFVRRGVWAVA